jgi:hypothetical protein
MEMAMPRRPTKKELIKINKHYVKGEDKLGENDLWVLEVEGAKAGVQTAYFSFLTPKSIRNFTRDTNAKAKNPSAPTVSYYLNHDTTSRLPLGALFDAEATGSEDELIFRHKVFLPSGYSSGDVTVDDYVKSVKMSMSEQVSVGFLAKKYVCRLCQNDIRSPACAHWPGRRYNVGTEESPDYKICTYDVDDAHLIEESAAWRGALPGARILSVSGATTDSGSQSVRKPNIKDFPEDSVLKFSFSDGSIEIVEDIDFEALNSFGGIVMSEENKEMEGLAVELEQLKAENETLRAEACTIKTQNTELTEKVSGLESSLGEANEKMSGVEVKLAEVQTVADRYVAEIKESIKKTLVAIDADGYNEEVSSSVISRMTLDELVAYRDDLKKRLSKVIPTGRQTKDDGDQPKTYADYADKSVFKIGRK